MAEKKSTYNASAQKRYQEKHGLTTIAVKVTQAQKEAIKDHAATQGYASVNAYLLHLIQADGVELGQK